MSRSTDNSDRVSGGPTFLETWSIRRVRDWRQALQRRRFTRRLDRLIARPACEISLRLDVEWRAAAVHAWDQDLPPDQQARLYAARLLDDTVSRIWSLFSAFPELDVVQIRVRSSDPPDGILLAGTVSRDALAACESCLSSAMRLKLLGVEYALRDGHFERLPPEHEHGDGEPLRLRGRCATSSFASIPSAPGSVPSRDQR